MKLTERQQFLVVVIGAVAVLWSLWHFVVAPQNRRRQTLENEIRQIATGLSDRYYLQEEAPLRNKLYDEEHRVRELSRQWLQTAERLAGFPDHHSLARGDIARIDYKAALFAVRQRLRAKSTESGIPLPHALGMEDAVGTDEDTRTLMLQLRAAERLADLALDLRIAEIQHIEPKHPIRHAISEGAPAYLEEYPVRMVFHGSMNNLHALFRAATMPDHVFLFRHVRIDRNPERAAAGRLEFDVILSALFFLQDAGQLAEHSEPTPLRRIPW